MTAEPALTDVPWWEEDAYRESLELDVPLLIDRLGDWLQPIHLAAAMHVLPGHLSYWYTNGVDEEEQETRLRLIYHAVKMTLNYGGKDGQHLLHHPTRDYPPVRRILQEPNPQDLLRKVRVTLQRCWKPDPKNPRQS